MHNDDEMVGRLLTRRELVALFGASAVAAAVHRVSGQAPAAAAAVPGCVVQPQQTEGPYFVDEKMLRSDIRSDPSNGVVKAGSQLDLKLKFSDVTQAGTCGPLVGAQVDIWQCDAMGIYSDVRDPMLFQTVGQKFLRGHQITNAAGEVQFVTIYPGWYPDRAIHIHFKVRTTPQANAGYEFTSQLYFDEALTDRVHANEPYKSHAGKRMRNEEDFIYREGGKQLLMKVVEKGGNKYASAFDIGVRTTDKPSSRWGRFGGFGGRG